jgi:hypothetical protein
MQMATYAELIESTRLVARVEMTTTTGDISYDGTALEVSDENGNELFHIVVDSQGDRQLLVFGADGDFRLPLSLFEQILATAKQQVNQVLWPPRESE